MADSASDSSDKNTEGGALWSATKVREISCFMGNIMPAGSCSTVDFSKPERELSPRQPFPI